MGNWTLNFKGVDIKVDYEYEPPEDMVLYYGDGSGYPGSPEMFNILEVTHKGADITELCEVHFEAIKDAIRDEWTNERENY